MRILPGTVLALTLMVGACGKEKEDDGDTEKSSQSPSSGIEEIEGVSGTATKVTADAAVYKAPSGSAEVSLDFSEAIKGSAYVIMPFALGDPATIKGATTDQLTFTVTSAGGALRLRDSVLEPEMDDISFDHSRRSLLNRFDPKLGEDQGEWFWSVARKLDMYAMSNKTSFNIDSELTIEETFRNAVKKRRSHSQLTTTLTGDCPAGGGRVVVPDTDDPTTDSSVLIPSAEGSVVSASDYCIVYLSTPETAGSKTEIETSVKGIMKRYKDVIYKDQFTAASSGFTFKPVIVVIDVGDGDKWPQSVVTAGVTGAFISSMSSVAGMPMIYMPSDWSKTSGASTDTALNKKLWHGTLAHEMQHAIMDYYRKRVTSGVEEVPVIDEGLAHYMEDLFGYGEENFGGFAKAYLDVWSLTSPAFIHASEDDKTTRGGAQAFWYYLISQKGGVEFTDGIVSGGKGLDFIASYVKSTTQNGPANIASVFGKTLTQLAGGFFGALAVDGTTTAPSVLKTQDPVSTLVNLTGDKGRTYGMHFNNYGGLAAHPDWDTKLGSVSEVKDIPYYGTKPIYYEVTSVGAKVTLKAQDAIANTAVTVVKVK